MFSGLKPEIEFYRIQFENVRKFQEVGFLITDYSLIEHYSGIIQEFWSEFKFLKNYAIIWFCQYEKLTHIHMAVEFLWV